MRLLVGIARLADSVITFAFSPNMHRISGYILYGDMDFILLRPISAQFTATLRYIDVYQAPHMVINLGVILYALHQIQWVPSAAALIASGAMFGAGIAILYSLWLIIATSSFWLVRQASNVSELLGILLGAAQYPRRIFPEFLQFVFTFIVPLAFVAVSPAQALAGGPDPRYVAISALLAAAGLYLSHRFWVFATRYYASASS